jgi:hypothetical protein
MALASSLDFATLGCFVAVSAPKSMGAWVVGSTMLRGFLTRFT